MAEGLAQPGAAGGVYRGMDRATLDAGGSDHPRAVQVGRSLV
jgi:hypothetical protein